MLLVPRPVALLYSKVARDGTALLNASGPASRAKHRPAGWPVGAPSLALLAPRTGARWTRAGDCVLWNGSINGGSPAMVDLHGAVTHPLVVLTALLWGSIVGAKVTLVICLFLGGLAQWWLAHLPSILPVAQSPFSSCVRSRRSS